MSSSSSSSTALPIEIAAPTHLHNTVDSIDQIKSIADIDDEHKICFIDVRGQAERESDGMIPHARHLFLDHISTALELSAEDFQTKFGYKKPNLDTPIVIHCRSGVRAVTAQNLFLDKGYTHVKTYPGSWREWYAKMILPGVIEEHLTNFTYMI